jgi:hypothetical protein
MIKKTFFFLCIAVIVAAFTYGCNIKTTTTTWGPTETNTPIHSPTVSPTITTTYTATPYVTPTITPGAMIPQSHFYSFEAGMEGWVNGSAYLLYDGFGLSVAHNTDALYCDAASAGSLQLNTDFAGVSQSHAAVSISLGGDQNLEYHTLSARIYVPAGICTATNPIQAGVFLGSSSAGYAILAYSYNVTSAGWHDLSWPITTFGGGITHYQHVDELGVVLYKDISTCTVTYAGPVYIDNVAW